MAGSVKTFVVYARSDSDLRDRLLKHLEPLRLQGLISTWHDADISGGEEWESAINANMADSELILLLISPDFMASEYIQSKELAEALRRHEEGTATVVPVFLRPALWEIANFAKLQGFPRSGQAVESSSGRTIDEALLEVARGIGNVLESIGKPEPPAPVASSLDDRGPEEARASEALAPAKAVSTRPTDLTAALDAAEAEFDQVFRRDQPYLRLVAYPGTLNSDIVDIEAEELRSLLMNPPGLRADGWNVGLRTGSIGHWRDGLQVESQDARLRLSTSGIMEFVRGLDPGFRWREKEDGFVAGPRLYPYPVVEYPLSFASLYRDVVSLAQLPEPLSFELQYWDLDGWYLPPYLPRQTGFIFSRDLTPYADKHFRTIAVVESRDFDPGEVTATLLRPLYRSFGHGSDAIPTYDRHSRRVTFDLGQQ